MGEFESLNHSRKAPGFAGGSLIYCLSVAGMLCLLLLPVNQYSWMSQLEPEIIFLPTDPHQSDRAIFSLCLVVAIGIMQAGLALTTSRRT